jgi:hypothetical protein
LPTRESTAPRAQKWAAYFAKSRGRRLGPLLAERFPSFRKAQRLVSRDGHIEAAKAYYFTPHEYFSHEPFELLSPCWSQEFASADLRVDLSKLKKAPASSQVPSTRSRVRHVKN